MSQIGTLTASTSSSIVLSYLPQYLTIEGNLPTTLGSNPQSQLNVTSLNVSVDGVEVCNIQGKDEINTSFFAGKQISLVTSPDAKWYASTYYMELSNGKIDGRVIDTRYNNGKIVRRISSTGKEIILDYGSEGKTIIDMFTQSRAYRKFIGWE